MGFLCFSLCDANGYHILNALSKVSKEFEQHFINDKWNKYIVKGTKKCTKGSSIEFAALDNNEEHDTIKSVRLTRFLHDDPFTDDDPNSTFINHRCLLDKEKKLDDDGAVCDAVNEFFKASEIVLESQIPL